MNLIVILCAIHVFALTLCSQNQPHRPRAGLEHHRLQYFVGDWKFEGEAKPTPFGPAGKFSGIDHDAMFGDFFLTIHTDGSGPKGPHRSIAVLGYDRREQFYTYDGFTSYGEHSKATGTVSGDTWSWNFSGSEGGKAYTVRITIKELSPTAYTFTEETSVNGGPWTKSVEAKATKQ